MQHKRKMPSSDSDSSSSDSSSESSSSSSSSDDSKLKNVGQTKLKQPHLESSTQQADAKKRSMIISRWEIKKPCIYKWSEEDIITLLKCLIEFKSLHGTRGDSPFVDMWFFHSFMVNKKLQLVGVTKWQMSDKVTRLRKKMLVNLQKSGRNPVFTNPHDYFVFELSKKLWLEKSDEKEVVVANNKDEKVKEVQVDFQTKYPLLAASFDMGNNLCVDIMKKNMNLIGIDKAREFEGKLKKLQDEEADLKLRRLDLVRESYKLIMETTRDK